MEARYRGCVKELDLFPELWQANEAMLGQKHTGRGMGKVAG